MKDNKMKDITTKKDSRTPRTSNNHNPKEIQVGEKNKEKTLVLSGTLSTIEKDKI